MSPVACAACGWTGRIACERVRKEAAQARLDLLAPPPAPQQETLL